MADPTASDVGTSDDAAPAETGSGTGVVPPGERGSLVVKDRAIERIAAAAALGVPGVVRHSGGGILRLTGRDLPRADVTTGAKAVAVNLYIAAEWPYDAAMLTRRVHDAVERQLHDLTGMRISELNVLIVATALVEDGETDEAQPPVEYLESDIVAARTTPHPDIPTVAPLPPLAPPAAAPAAAIVAIAALALSFVAARELLIVNGTYGGAPWLRNSFEWFGRLHWHTWLAPIAGVCLVLGIVLIVVSLKPRRRTHVPLQVAGPVPTVWMRRTDVARMCSAHASALTGVRTARTVVDRRRAVVRISIEDETPIDEITASVRGAVAPNLAALADPVELVVEVAR
ncbi:DUF6286 domain-containing Asp23/Gls24 family envelope stress response protein [Rhodococcus rhodochrous]|uniref:DUF6286 domain-containing Asp23/Gls24 family envelope stress response protein n=1 Tax=Rhodococcus rhodochrous TaxID=1829 RepID=UPI0032E002AF